MNGLFPVLAAIAIRQNANRGLYPSFNTPHALTKAGLCCFAARVAQAVRPSSLRSVPDPEQTQATGRGGFPCPAEKVTERLPTHRTQHLNTNSTHSRDTTKPRYIMYKKNVNQNLHNLRQKTCVILLPIIKKTKQQEHFNLNDMLKLLGNKKQLKKNERK
jgi:hypothetical protein